MNSAKVSHQLLLSSWADRIRCQQESGLRIKDWCSQNDVSRDQFYYWKRRLKDACLESALPDIVPLNLPSSDQSFTSCTTLSTPAFDPASVDDPTLTSCTTPSLKLCMDDVSIEIHPDTPSDLIIKVIKAVRNA